MATKNHDCRVCSKPAALLCLACANPRAFGITNDEKEAWYCSTECQRKDWQNHKTYCQQVQVVKRFYRAGSTLHKLFLLFRSLTYDQNVSRVEKEDGKLILYDDRTVGVNQKESELTFHPWLFPGPAELQAGLVYGAAADAVAWTVDIASYLLHDIASEIHEVTVTTINFLDVVLIDDNGTEVPGKDNTSHQILKVDLDIGTSFALDLAGAQVGHFDPVYPWEAYLSERVSDKSLKTEKHGFTRAVLWDDTIPRIADPNGVDPINLLKRLAHYTLKNAVVAWEKENKTTFKQMALLQEKSFQAQERNLVEFVRSSLDQAKKDIKASNIR